MGAFGYAVAVAGLGVAVRAIHCAVRLADITVIIAKSPMQSIIRWTGRHTLPRRVIRIRIIRLDCPRTHGHTKPRTRIRKVIHTLRTQPHTQMRTIIRILIIRCAIRRKLLTMLVMSITPCLIFTDRHANPLVVLREVHDGEDDGAGADASTVVLLVAVEGGQALSDAQVGGVVAEETRDLGADLDATGGACGGVSVVFAGCVWALSDTHSRGWI